MEMKKVYAPKQNYGYEGPWEVEQDYPVPFPHTDVEVPDGIYSPYFNWDTRQWEEATPPETVAYMKKMEDDIAKAGRANIVLTLTDMKQQKQIDALKPAEEGEANV